MELHVQRRVEFLQEEEKEENPLVDGVLGVIQMDLMMHVVHQMSPIISVVQTQIVYFVNVMIFVVFHMELDVILVVMSGTHPKSIVVKNSVVHLCQEELLRGVDLYHHFHRVMCVGNGIVNQELVLVHSKTIPIVLVEKSTVADTLVVVVVHQRVHVVGV